MGPYWRGEANKPSGFHLVNRAKVSEGGWGGGQPLLDLWKHAEVGATGSNQQKIRPATGARLLVNVCNVCQRSPSACLLCSWATLTWARSIRSDPFSSPDNQDDRQSRALLHFVLISWTESWSPRNPPPRPLWRSLVCTTLRGCAMCGLPAVCIYIFLFIFPTCERYQHVKYTCIDKSIRIDIWGAGRDRLWDFNFNDTFWDDTASDAS